MRQTEFINTVMPFKDKLYRMAKRLLVSNEEAEDATQEVFLKLWSNADRMKNYKSVEAFAMTMTKNYCLDRLKSKHASNLKLVHSNYQDNNVSLQKQVETSDSLDWVQKIIKDLPQQQQLVFQLRDIEHYSFEEIENIMEMNATAVRVTLSRARKKIREELLKKHSYGVS